MKGFLKALGIIWILVLVFGVGIFLLANTQLPSGEDFIRMLGFALCFSPIALIMFTKN